MEDEKKVTQNSQMQNSKGQGGGRRRRHRNRHKSGQPQNPQAQNAQNVQNVQNQSGQNNKKQNNQGNQNNQNKPNKQNNNGQKQNPQKQEKQKQNPQKQEKQQKQDKQNREKQGKKAENRKDTYAYSLDGKLYLNLTNKCSNGCDFCVRNERDSYYGHYLWLNHGEVTFEKVLSACNGFGDLTKFEEIVFCGFGEPTYRMDLIVKLSDYFHEKGLKTRLNTNGQGSLINKRDIIPELVGKVDKINVSLNASCAENYQKICRSQFGENGFGAMVEFAKGCKRAGIDCRFSIVDCIGETEIESCKRLAQSAGVPLLIRKYIVDC
ncbi:MAG: TatD family nuclease-associated radical SAM protein [Clostridia bacterium]|nr:TatD family nuclease-associated radical SAM protein [Clostridia bacterium]